MTKKLSFWTPGEILTCLLTLSLRKLPIGVFSKYFRISPFLGISCRFQKKTTKFIKLFFKFHVIKVTFLASQCQQQTSTVKSPVLALRVYETKLTSKNPFIVNLFALGSEKGCKYGQKTLIWNSPRSLDLYLNTYPPNDVSCRFSALL